MSNEQRDGLLIDLADSLKREDELRERCAFYERTNAEQAAILNRVIAERDDWKVECGHAEALAAKCMSELSALRLKCDEAVSACASETCAMAKKVAAVTAERDDYRAALEMITKMAARYASQALAKHTEDEVERAMRMV